MILIFLSFLNHGLHINVILHRGLYILYNIRTRRNMESWMIGIAMRNRNTEYESEYDKSGLHNGENKDIDMEIGGIVPRVDRISGRIVP